MKKLNLFLLLMSTSAALSANECSPFNGFYVGVTGGVALPVYRFNTQRNILVTSTGLVETVQVFQKERITDVKGSGEIFAGGGFQCHSFYLGGRIGGNFTDSSVHLNSGENLNTTSPTFLQTDISSNPYKLRLSTAEFIFDFKPGWIFCSRAMLFGILGGAVNREKISAAQLDTFTVTIPPGPPVTTTDNISVKNQKTRVGFRAGFGLEYLLSRCIGLQVGYLYTYYPKISAETTVSFPSLDEITTLTLTVHPQKHYSFLGVSYYF